MTKDEMQGLTYVWNNFRNVSIKNIFNEIFLIDSKDVVRGFNKVALRDYSKKQKEEEKNDGENYNRR